MFFDDWASMGRILLVGSLSYVALVLMLRIAGKRTLSKLNAFDLVITVALGSALAQVVLSSEVALLEGLLAFGLLASLQFIVAWTSVRSSALRRLVKAEPRLVVHHGQLLHDAMKAERVTRDEVLQALRNHGVASLAEVDAIVLETDGTLDVIVARSAGDGSAVADVA